MKGLVRRRLEVLRRLPPGDSRALISDPNADYNAPETIMDIGCRLLVDVEQIRREVAPLRERVRILEEAHAPDEDPEEEVRRRTAEENIGDLNRKIKDQERQIEQLYVMFDESQEKELSDYIVWQRETLQSELAELPKQQEELEKANDALIELMDSEAVEEEGKASMKIEELRAMLSEMRSEEAEMMEEHEALLKSEPSAIEDAKIIASWDKKLRNVQHVKAQRKLEMSKLIKLQKSQIENMEASIADKKRREDQDRAREAWRRSYHQRADAERERRLKAEEEHARQREIEMQEEMERKKKAQEEARRKKKQLEERRKRAEEKKQQDEAERRARHKHRHKRRRVLRREDDDSEEEEEDEIGDVVRAHLAPVVVIDNETRSEEESEKEPVEDESEAAHIQEKLNEFDSMERQIANMLAGDKPQEQPAAANEEETDLSSTSSSDSQHEQEPEPPLELAEDPRLRQDADTGLSASESSSSDLEQPPAHSSSHAHKSSDEHHSSDAHKSSSHARKSSDEHKSSDEDDKSSDEDSSSDDEAEGHHGKRTRRRVSKVRRRVRVGKHKVRVSKEHSDDNLTHFDDTPVGVVERPPAPKF